MHDAGDRNHRILLARVILCGRAAAYSLEFQPPGPSLLPIIAARASVLGILAEDYLPYLPELIRVVGGWVRDGRFHYREDISDGLASAPAAFCRLLRGENFGKAIVRISAEHL